MRFAVAPRPSDVGGVGLSATVMAAGAVMVMVAEAVFVVSVTEVAVTVTVPDVGTVAGAVYTVAVPLGVEVGLKDPQDELLQVTAQVTPLF